MASHTNPKTFSIEDVFFTGIVRVKAGLPEPILANNNRQLCTHILDLDRQEKVKKIRTIVFEFCKNHFIPAVECLMNYKKYQKYDKEGVPMKKISHFP